MKWKKISESLRKSCRKWQFVQHSLHITQINTTRLNMERREAESSWGISLGQIAKEWNMSQSGESGSCNNTRGLECSTVGASVMCELWVMVSGDSVHWHIECHYWPASCPSLTAVLQEAKYIIISYLNCSFQINILFPSFRSQRLQLHCCYFRGNCHFNCCVWASS